MLEHFTCCLRVYALQYYYKLEMAYNKYYFKHTTVVNHKPSFVMAKEDPILDTIDNKSKDNTIKIWQWM